MDDNLSADVVPCVSMDDNLSADVVPCVSMDDNLSADGVGNLTREGHSCPKTFAERRINKRLD
jgi:hypothetical protein